METSGLSRVRCLRRIVILTPSKAVGQPDAVPSTLRPMKPKPSPKPQRPTTDLKRAIQQYRQTQPDGHNNNVQHPLNASARITSPRYQARQSKASEDKLLKRFRVM
ncbi:hypothetical protein ACLOJK_007863 [Asimina triloba]